MACSSEVLGQIVGNLLGNAIKYRATDRRCQVKISCVADGAMARLAVSDNGIGMSAEAARRAFEPFFRASQDRPGHGLGLSIVERYVHAVHGSVTLTSQPRSRHAGGGLDSTSGGRPRSPQGPTGASAGHRASGAGGPPDWVARRTCRRAAPCVTRGPPMRVVVAMSGGVDSSAAAALLKEQGHEVIGITLRVWSYEGAAKCGSCCSPDDIDDARAVAADARHPVLRRERRGALQGPGGQPVRPVVPRRQHAHPVRRLQPRREVRLPAASAPARSGASSPPATTRGSSSRTASATCCCRARRRRQGPELLPLHPRPGGAAPTSSSRWAS